MAVLKMAVMIKMVYVQIIIVLKNFMIRGDVIILAGINVVVMEDVIYIQVNALFAKNQNGEKIVKKIVQKNVRVMIE